VQVAVDQHGRRRAGRQVTREAGRRVQEPRGYGVAERRRPFPERGCQLAGVLLRAAHPARGRHRSRHGQAAQHRADQRQRLGERQVAQRAGGVEPLQEQQPGGRVGLDQQHRAAAVPQPQRTDLLDHHVVRPGDLQRERLAVAADRHHDAVAAVPHRAVGPQPPARAAVGDQPGQRGQPALARRALALPAPERPERRRHLDHPAILPAATTAAPTTVVTRRGCAALRDVNATHPTARTHPDGFPRGASSCLYQTRGPCRCLCGSR
jgi:hypothetical protein